jgi:hypothetical protein
VLCPGFTLSSSSNISKLWLNLPWYCYLQIPYENLTPLQAALSVRQVCFSIEQSTVDSGCTKVIIGSLLLVYQGFRLVIPSTVHPRLSKLIQRCWDENPHMRPVFSDITVELEDILHSVQVILLQFVGHKSHEKMKFEHKVIY